MHRYSFVLLLLLAGPATRGQAVRLDSLRTGWMDPSQPDTVRLAHMGDAVRLLMGDDPESALVVAAEMEALAQRASRPIELGFAVNGQGFAHFNKGRFRQAMERFEKAYDIRVANHDPAAARSLMNIGNVYKELNQPSRAVDCYQRAATELERLHDTNGAANVYYNISAMYADWNTASTAEYLQRALDLDPEPGLRFMVLVGMGMNKTALGDAQGAIETLHTALRATHEPGMTLWEGYVEQRLGMAYIKTDSLDEAEVHLKRALELHRAAGQSNAEVDTRSYLAQVELQRDRPVKALGWLTPALALVRPEESSHELRLLYRRLYTAHKRAGHAAEALLYSDLERQVSDSLRSREAERAMSAMEFAKQLQADSLKNAEEKTMAERSHQLALDAETDRKRLFMFGGIGVLLLALVLWRLLGRTRREKARSEEILHNVLPEEVAREIRETGTAKSREIDQVSILFTDFKGFTELSATLPRQELMAEIDACFKVFDGISHRHGVEKIKTIGDAYMAAAGLNGVAHDAAVNTVRAALEMQAFIEARYAERNAQGLPAFRMRVGIHTGPVVAGIVGVKKFQYDIWGDTVNTASRMESSSEVGQVNISEATYALVQGDAAFTFTPRGKVQAKGKGEMEMYFVERK